MSEQPDSAGGVTEAPTGQGVRATQAGGAESPSPSLSLVLPCYNEAPGLHSTVTQLVAAFHRESIAIELVLVDNGSSDGTGDVIDKLASEGLPVVKETVPVNQGYGYGILRGLPRCRGTLAGFMCADGQVAPDDVVRIYEVAVKAVKPKLVKVRRRFRMDGWSRKVVSIVFNGATSVLFAGLGSIDVNGNPKILPRRELERMDLRSKGWFLDAEVMIKAKRLGLEVYELNVMAKMREEGVSHVRASAIGEFATELARYRLGLDGWKPEASSVRSGASAAR